MSHDHPADDTRIGPVLRLLFDRTIAVQAQAQAVQAQAQAVQAQAQAVQAQAQAVQAPEPDRLTLAEDPEPHVHSWTPTAQNLIARRFREWQPGSRVLAHVTLRHHTGPYAGLEVYGFQVIARWDTCGRVSWPSARVEWPTRTYSTPDGRWRVLAIRPQDPDSPTAQATIRALESRIVQATARAYAAAADQAARERSR